MGSETQNPMVAFESWLLYRVAHAVKAGEVSADLLAELRTEMERARDVPQEEGHAQAVQDIAERLDLRVKHAEKLLAALESQPPVTRELVLRRTVELWLAGQREASRSGPGAKSPREDPR